MEDKAYIKTLFRKYLENQLSEEEMTELLRYFQLTDQDDMLYQLILEELEKEIPGEEAIVKSIGDNIGQRLFEKTKATNQNIVRVWWTYAAAAMLLISLALGWYNFKDGFSFHEELSVFQAPSIQPGGNRATISFTNGQVVALREDQDGIVSKGGQLYYTDGSQVMAKQYSGQVKLSTPRAGQYKITFQDGTQVWLNSATILTFPTTFNENARQVNVEGEAYFNVTHRAQQPFVVYTDKQAIKVLGTRFNVFAYKSEPIQHTTLEEGAVEVKKTASELSISLTPGSQVVSDNTGHMSIRAVDPIEYISWKDGVIILNSYGLPEILRQLERWYDVEFYNIPEDVKSDRVFGMIQRDVPLNDVLKTLMDNYSTIQFIIKGRRIMVSKR